MSIPRGREHRRTVARVHTSTDLDRCERLVIDGIPMTDLARTILDVGRKVGDQKLLQAIEWSRREQDLDWSDAHPDARTGTPAEDVRGSGASDA